MNISNRNQKVVLWIYLISILVFGAIFVPWRIETTWGDASGWRPVYTRSTTSPIWSPPENSWPKTMGGFKDAFALDYTNGIDYALLGYRVIALSLGSLALLQAVRRRE